MNAIITSGWATQLMRVSLSAVGCTLVIEGTLSGLGEEQEFSIDNVKKPL